MSLPFCESGSRHQGPRPPTTLFILLFLQTLHFHHAHAAKHSSQWRAATRRWIGPDWWANPLQDWSLRKGEVTTSALHDRTLCLTTYSVISSPASLLFRAAVRVRVGGVAAKLTAHARLVTAGFRIGRRGPNPSYLSGLLDANEYIDAALTADGRLVLFGRSVRITGATGLQQRDITLTLTARRLNANTVRLHLEAATPGNTIGDANAVVRSKDILGGMSLLADGPEPTNARTRTPVAFRDFRIDGPAILFHKKRRLGPIMWTQYLLSDGVLKLQAQLMPVVREGSGRGGGGGKVTARLRTMRRGGGGAKDWTERGERAMHPLARTVTWTVRGWDKRFDHRYFVSMRWDGRVYSSDGLVRTEPLSARRLKMGVFSCDYGYLFPHAELTRKVRAHNPDLLYFAGDQIYETNDAFGNEKFGSISDALLDYLRRWYRFGLTWGPLLRNRPSVILPDDHDVFHGDLFGHGGRRLQLQVRGGRRVINYQMGGYLMPGTWVSAVERTQVGTLPTPANPRLKLPIGIRTHFTAVQYANISFAVLEDRKFKTGPESLPKGPARERGTGAHMLGAAQERFLKSWVARKRPDIALKIALTQTIPCKLTTHSSDALRRNRFVYDSGAWPLAARNRVVALLARAGALSMHGDQHLGAVVQMKGDGNDILHSFMVPGTANGWPRAFWPEAADKKLGPPHKKYTGQFTDDAGHQVNVLAIANPEKGQHFVAKRFTDKLKPFRLAYKKGSGYGIVTLDKESKTARIALYHIGITRDAMFKGFPKTVQLGSGKRREERNPKPKEGGRKIFEKEW